MSASVASEVTEANRTMCNCHICFANVQGGYKDTNLLHCTVLTFVPPCRTIMKLMNIFAKADFEEFCMRV